jgi:hypothetical protein
VAQTDAEKAQEDVEYEAFAEAWTRIEKQGYDRGWLRWSGYESGPELYSPTERRTEEFQRAERERLQAALQEKLRIQREKEALFEKRQADLKKEIFGK